MTFIQTNTLFIIGISTALALFFGKSMKFVKLPSIIGYMIIGVILGTSGFNLLNENLQSSLDFITDIALGFVALSIGLELNFKSLKKLGMGIVIVIFTESFGAFILVTGFIYLLTKDLPLSLIFGSIAPASAPAGTVAIIQEYKAKGPLTSALYAVVGFDDGLGIIIFGFAAAFAKSLLGAEIGLDTGSIAELLLVPMKEVVLSLIVGGVVAVLFSLLSKAIKSGRDIFILLFSFVLISTGICNMLHLSLILTNMIFGIVVVNTQKVKLVEKIHDELTQIMPLLFVLFFTLAGANLNIAAIPSLGLIGLLYLIGRSAGLIFGASIGAHIGNLSESIKKYLGIGILSQAGVAIGLALIVKSEFVAFGDHGIYIGSTVINTVTATSIIFGIFSPILTKIGLVKSGEITVNN
ncbi:MAG: cation:proton antiporter [Spirochaetales bacterium]|nr:cation:proton antiporter [Spirochaetales bacterium]